MAVSFLTTRVKASDEDDWGKLVRVLKYINGTWYMKLILSARLCIPTGVPIYSGPHFPEFRIFRGISGFRRKTHRNHIGIKSFQGKTGQD